MSIVKLERILTFDCLVDRPFASLRMIVMPFGNLMSRHYERQADKYSVQEMGKEAFISAMNRLEEINLGDRTPHRIVEFLLYSHPSIGKRVEMAEKQEED